MQPRVSLSRGLILNGAFIASFRRAVLNSPVWVDVGQLGRKTMFYASCLFSALFAFPLFWLSTPRSNDRDPDHRGRDQLWPDGDVRHRGALVFRTVHRAAALYGASLGFQVGAALSGGLSPLIAASLMTWAGGAPGRSRCS